MSKRKCGCGKSPTGYCIGWHGLSGEEYKKKLAEYQKEQERKNDSK